MPKAPLFHASERVDKIDLDYAALFGRNTANMHIKKMILDQQDRIVEGFRVELPDQDSYPGRIVVHGGAGFNRDGQLVFTEDQLDITRDITLIGANTTFYVEIEFFESNSDVDARAFWDATVEHSADPSGDPVPNGQEFFANVATRKYPDWRIVQPVSTTGFTRDGAGTISSTKIPLLKVATDASNKITVAVNTGLVTDVPTTILLEKISNTTLRVQDASLFLAGYQIIVSYGSATPETATVFSVDNETGLLTLAGSLTLTHVPGDIIRLFGATPVYIDQSKIGRYRRLAETNVIDYRDRMFQGDEIHGDLMSRGFSSATEKSDLSLRSMKDYIDFLAAQIEEMKWGSPNPYEQQTETRRTPPGLLTGLPSIPRYYDSASSIMGARTAAITVGDGTNSWGDFNGNTEAVIQAAHDALPVGGGRIFLKRGAYTLSNDFNWTNTGFVTIEGEEGTTIFLDGGMFLIETTGSVSIKTMMFQGATSFIGIKFDTDDPSNVNIESVLFWDSALHVNSILPGSSSFRRVWLWGLSSGMVTAPLLVVGLDGTLSGTFNECDFNHVSMLSATCSLIDCVNNTPTHGCSGVNFQDCTFATALLNFESIHLGATSNFVQFDRCYFMSWFTLCHVKATAGSKNIKLTNCVAVDVDGDGVDVATLLEATGCTHVEVSGYVNNAVTILPSLIFTNCNNVKIRSCDVNITSGASQTTAAFRIVNNVGGTAVENIEILGNTINGGSDYCTGIIFDLAGGQEIRSVSITGNNFSACENGIYFANSGAAATYSDINISGNTFIDRDGLFGVVGLYQKVGIYGGTTSSKVRWSIIGNTFTNFNPLNNNTCAGITRNAIYLAGLSNYEIEIKTNRMLNMDNATLSGVAGIRTASLYNSTIEGNSIVGTRGQYAYAMMLGGITESTTISNNVIKGVYSSTASVRSCAGIVGYQILSCSISNNVIRDIEPSGASSYGAGIMIYDTTNGQVYGTSIVGNVFFNTSTVTGLIDSISFDVNGCSFVTISGNTHYDSYHDQFIRVVSTTGGFIEQLAITGNSDTGGDISVLVYGSGAACSNVSICSNTFKTNGIGIDVDGVYFGVTINNNSVWNTADNMCIYVDDCFNINITGNNCRRAAGTGDTIKIDSGCDTFLITGNRCEDSAVTGKSINTSATTGEGFSVGNFMVAPPSYGANTDNLGGYPSGSKF